ncbi:50S ribosomal protein L25 [candidate division KSB1 bacterium]|nr:50S ribosomal protein L25 [candidate division KSB1 bacterium]RQV99912.1 MAG: 50S ribosomal protein L25 [candidate division KSB1 bacterium]
MSEVTLNVETRTGLGTGAVKKLRRQNKIPGIFYFHGSKNLPFVVDRAELHSVWGHESGLLEIIFDSKTHKKCVVRDIQFDPVKGTPIHIDLMGIKMTEKLRVNVHIQLNGTPDGVKNAGGVLQHTIRELEVECLPTDIPDSIEVDVTELGIGDSIHVSDIMVENVTVLTDPSTVIATVSAPRVIAEQEVVEEEGEEEAQPEVISQKTEDTE